MLYYPINPPTRGDYRYNLMMQFSSSERIICATSRLARGMQLRAQVRHANSQSVWQSVNASTLSQWLDETLEAAMLLGLIPKEAMPAQILNGFSETHLWEMAISQSLAKHASSVLFDITSLAKTAMSAHQTLIEWQVPESALRQAAMTQESRQFLNWQQRFLALCQDKHCLDASLYLQKQIDLVCQYALPIAKQMTFAGFDRMTPLMERLINGLRAQDVMIRFENIDHHPNAVAEPNINCVTMQDAKDECRAAVAWAKTQLLDNPQAQIAIISPTLREERAYLSSLLDDAFHPETLLPDRYEAPRIYDFSLGLALSAYPIVNCALQLLRLSVVRHAKPIEMLAPILHDVYWGELSELSDRALLDAHLRQKVSAVATLSKITQLAEMRVSQNDAPIQSADNASSAKIETPHYLQALQHLCAFQARIQEKTSPKKLASHWLSDFLALLTGLNWANTRSLSSIEYQTHQRFLETIETLAKQDNILGLITPQECLSALSSICQQAMFQAESVGEVHIQLLGLLETPALALDGVWVMHMNDQHWPPAVKLNPLLPVKLQRDLALPNTSSLVQTQFANIVQSRVNKMAKNIVFSYAYKSHEQILRPSPLLNDLPHQAHTHTLPLSPTLCETLAEPYVMESLADHIATAISKDDNIRGGTQLFKRQAICPAWAFYQHRLGAKALATPAEGLESKDHGNLLHTALEQFWGHYLSLAAVKALTDEALFDAVSKAVTDAITIWQASTLQRVSAQVLKIEAARLQKLLLQFLAIEKSRADFVVTSLEKSVSHEIAGIPLTLTIDRIDTLIAENVVDKTVIMDYKSSQAVNFSSWAKARITEPQLPIYATIAMQTSEIAAVYFAQINKDKIDMRGLAMQKGIAPGLTAFDALKSDSAFNQFANWDALLQAWQNALNQIGEEIQRGDARVTFQKATDLQYCDVLPLLRLPERLHQFESSMLPTKKTQHQGV